MTSTAIAEFNATGRFDATVELLNEFVVMGFDRLAQLTVECSGTYVLLGIYGYAHDLSETGVSKQKRRRLAARALNDPTAYVNQLVRKTIESRGCNPRLGFITGPS